MLNLPLNLEEMSTQTQSLPEIDQRPTTKTKALSFLTGPIDVSLWKITLGQLLKQQAITYPSREAVVFSETGQRTTYKQLYLNSLAVAKGLLASGVRKGQCVGILAGNCSAYVELLFATAHIGAIYVVLNCSYTVAELKSALQKSGKPRYHTAVVCQLTYGHEQNVECYSRLLPSVNNLTARHWKCLVVTKSQRIYLSCST